MALCWQLCIRSRDWLGRSHILHLSSSDPLSLANMNTDTVRRLAPVHSGTAGDGDWWHTQSVWHTLLAGENKADNWKHNSYLIMGWLMNSTLCFSGALFSSPYDDSRNDFSRFPTFSMFTHLWLRSRKEFEICKAFSWLSNCRAEYRVQAD